MNRLTFVTFASTVFVSARPTIATSRKHLMHQTSIMNEITTKRPHIASMTVRHVGALVSTLSTIRPEQLQATKPVSVSHEPSAIDAAFAAIELAEPSPTNETSEARWNLSFADKHGETILIVTSSFTPLISVRSMGNTSYIRMIGLVGS